MSRTTEVIVLFRGSEHDFDVSEKDLNTDRPQGCHGMVGNRLCKRYLGDARLPKLPYYDGKGLIVLRKSSARSTRLAMFYCHDHFNQSPFEVNAILERQKIVRQKSLMQETQSLMQRTGFEKPPPERKALASKSTNKLMKPIVDHEAKRPSTKATADSIHQQANVHLYSSQLQIQPCLLSPLDCDLSKPNKPSKLAVRYDSEPKVPKVETPVVPDSEQKIKELQTELQAARKLIASLQLTVAEQDNVIKTYSPPANSDTRHTDSTTDTFTKEKLEDDGYANIPLKSGQKMTDPTNEPSNIRSRPSMTACRDPEPEPEPEPESSSRAPYFGSWNPLRSILCGCNIGRYYEEI